MELLGVDDGHWGIKICSGFDERGQAICHYMKSRCLPGIHQTVSMGGGSLSAWYETQGENFTITDVGALLGSNETRATDYQHSAMSRVLVNHALTSAGYGGKEVSIMTGLPVGDYFPSGDRKNQKLIDAKIASLMTEVNAKHKTELPRIVKADVKAEAVMSYFDLSMNPDGTLNEEFTDLTRRRPMAIVDLGGKTLNIVVITEGDKKGIYWNRSGSVILGALEFRDRVSEALRSHFQLTGAPPTDYVEEAIQTRSYEIFGEVVDVSDIVEPQRDAFAARVKSEIQRKLGDGSDLAGIVFVGGGVSLLGGEDWAKKVYKGRTIVPDNPVFANARGMFKALKFASVQ